MTYRQEEILIKIFGAFLIVVFVVPALGCAAYAIWYTLLHTLLGVI